MPTILSRRIDEFINRTGEYIALGKRTIMFFPGEESSPSLFDKTRAIRERMMEYAQYLIDRMPALARECEDAGLDPTDILRVSNFHSEDGGGMKGLVKTWPDLRIRLQRLSILAGQASSHGHDDVPVTPDVPVDDLVTLTQAAPLSDRLQAVDDVIRCNGKPIYGKEICAQVPGLIQSTLTKHIIPELKKQRGLVNKAGAGYYYPTS